MICNFLLININFNINFVLIFQTCLPAGRYCDVISGNKENNACTGLVITVGSDGKAVLNLTNLTEDPIIAIHAESKL